MRTSRLLIAEVLEEKVATGYFSPTTAERLARRILSDNACELFRLEKERGCLSRSRSALASALKSLQGHLPIEAAAGVTPALRSFQPSAQFWRIPRSSEGAKRGNKSSPK